MSEANRAKAIAKYGQVLQSKKNLWTTVSDATIKSGAPIGGVLLGDIHRREACLLAVLLLISKILVFCVILYLTTMADTHRKFLSLVIDTDGAVCKEVPLTLTGIFSGSYDGYWETNHLFNFNSSLFTLGFNGIGVSSQEYHRAMNKFSTLL